jgi:hypothetical protein
MLDPHRCGHLLVQLKPRCLKREFAFLVCTVLQFTSDSSSFALLILLSTIQALCSMSTHSPPLIRMSTSTCPGSSSPHCKNSPSPTFHGRQTIAHGQSTSSFQGSYNGQPSPAPCIYHVFLSETLLSPHCTTVPGQICRTTSPL